MKTYKKILSILVLALTFSAANAQRIGDLNGINYQAVAVDEEGKEIVGIDVNGKPLYEKAIGVRFSILKGQDGPVQFQDVHETVTDQYGLFSLVIGQGEQTGEGEFDRLLDIPWIDADQWLKVEIAINNDGDYKLVSLQKFQTVPYSFYTDDIADDAITTEKILDSTILNQDLSTGAVDSRTILNETILTEDIATGAVTTDEILDGTILNEDIADGTIDLTTKVNGILPVDNGGTGLDATGVLDGQVLIGNDPNNNFDLATLTPGTGINIINTPGGIEIESTVTGINAAVAVNPIVVGNILSGTTWVSPAIPVPGVAFGDIIIGSIDRDLEGCQMTVYVTSANNVQISITNLTGGAINLGTVRPRVLVIN